MARITVEDCLPLVPNRYELVLLAAHRARALGVGAEPAVPWDRDKRCVVALRELGAGVLDPAAVREALVTSLQRHAVPDDRPEDEPAAAPLGDEIVWPPVTE